MVKGEREHHHLADADLALEDSRHRPDAPYPQDSYLRRVDDRGKTIHTQGAQVGDGKGAASQLVGSQGAVHRTLREADALAGQLEQPLVGG